MTKQQPNNEGTIQGEISYKEITLNIGHISSGKSFIISFYDKLKGKQIDQTPFQKKPNTGDGYYNYGFHFDLRKGKDIDRLQKKFKLLKPIEELREEENFKGITETSYTQLMIYRLFDYIQKGKFDIKGQNKSGEHIHLMIKWTGNPIERPEIKKEKEKTPKDKTPKKEITEGLDWGI